VPPPPLDDKDARYAGKDPKYKVCTLVCASENYEMSLYQTALDVEVTPKVI